MSRRIILFTDYKLDSLCFSNRFWGEIYKYKIIKKLYLTGRIYIHLYKIYDGIQMLVGIPVGNTINIFEYIILNNMEFFTASCVIEKTFNEFMDDLIYIIYEALIDSNRKKKGWFKL